jgi:hypothetical protein
MKPSQATNEIVDRVLGRSRSAAAKLTVVPSADNQASGKAWNEGLITAAALQSKQFKPVRIILPGLIPEGTTMLAGKPKVGKSWLALDVCLAVADETRFVLGDKKPVHGDVLYLALEDNQRRLKKRIDKIVQSSRWPKRLELHTEWKRMDRGGLEDIEAWCKSVKEPRLIWIDTLAKIRPIAGRNEQAYAADYRAIEGLQKLSGQYQVGIVLNHHLRKMSSEDDAFDDVSGTLLDQMLYRMRKAGEVGVAGRGLYSLPGKDPLNAGEIGEIEGSEAVPEQEATDSTSVLTPDESHHESHSNLTGAESGEIAGEIAETAKPFANNGNTNGSHHLTDLTGIEHSEPATDPRDPGPMPDFLVRKVPLDRPPRSAPRATAWTTSGDP